MIALTNLKISFKRCGKIQILQTNPSSDYINIKMVAGNINKTSTQTSAVEPVGSVNIIRFDPSPSWITFVAIVFSPNLSLELPQLTQIPFPLHRYAPKKLQLNPSEENCRSITGGKNENSRFLRTWNLRITLMNWEKIRNKIQRNDWCRRLNN